MFDDSYCFRKNEQILYRESGGAPGLIDPYRRTLISLNPAAAEIWQLLDGKHSVGDIVHALEEIFDIDEDRLRRDIVTFLKDLIRREAVS